MQVSLYKKSNLLLMCIHFIVFFLRLAQFATRATLLSTECMKSRGLYGESAHHFIRMTSEESDLRSALLLEQACYCFLQCTKPMMFRKYAFHMVLAGHRFSKAAQKKHALRCYKQAAQVYIGKGWNLAEDHVNFTIGKQANNLHLLNEAVAAFALMLSGKSKQSPQQQEIFLKEYLSAHVVNNSFYTITFLELEHKQTNHFVTVY